MQPIIGSRDAMHKEMCPKAMKSEIIMANMSSRMGWGVIYYVSYGTATQILCGRHCAWLSSR